MSTATRRFDRLSALAVTGGLAVAGMVAVAAPAANADSSHFVRGDQVDTSETRATGHNDFSASGVRVWTEGKTSTDKAAGYFMVNLPLADVGEPSMAWTSTEPAQAGEVRPGMQLRVDFDGDGDQDGLLVGEPVWANGSPLYGDDWWLTGGSDQEIKDAAPEASGGSGSAWHGTLDQWREVFPDAKVLDAGWSLGSGVKGDGTIAWMELGEHRYHFTAPAEAPQITPVYPSDLDLSHSRSKGHHGFLPDGAIRVYTDDADGESKAAGYFATDLPLSEVDYRAFLDFENTSEGQVPGVNLVVDFNNDGVYDGTLVSEPIKTVWWLAKSKLVGDLEEWVKDQAPRKPGDKDTPSYSAGGGKPWEWQAAFPQARVLIVGWSLGSGAKGDGKLTKVILGNHHFVFAANRAPSTPPVTTGASAGAGVVVTLPAFDPDNDEITFSSPDAVIVGNQLIYTPPRDFAGTKVISYTVTDSKGNTSTGTVTIVVAKAASTAKLKVKPGKITTKTTNVRLKGTVTSNGWVVGGVVTFYDGTKRVGRGVLTESGQVKVVLKRGLSKGKHKLKIVYEGTTSTETAEATVTVKVKKPKKKKKRN